MNMISSSFLPSSTSAISLVGKDSQGFLQYLREIQKFPMLTQEEEFEYASRFAQNGDKEAAKMLVQSHLRLVVKMATKFKNYGLPISDLVAEGNIGLIQAVKKFDPIKGFRFSTYAMWWIRAHIQEYILKSWSLVKIGTTAAQRKLFFNLSKIKKKLSSETEISIETHAEDIAKSMNVSKQEVLDMNLRLQNRDSSLNAKIGDDEEKEVGEFLITNEISQEEIAIQNQEKSRQIALFNAAFKILNEREKDILVKRQMSENSATLEDLSQIYKISRERVRQIEAQAIEKIKKEIRKLQKTAIN